MCGHFPVRPMRGFLLGTQILTDALQLHNYWDNFAIFSSMGPSKPLSFCWFALTEQRQETQRFDQLVCLLDVFATVQP